MHTHCVRDPEQIPINVHNFVSVSPLYLLHLNSIDCTVRYNKPEIEPEAGEEIDNFLTIKKKSLLN